MVAIGRFEGAEGEAIDMLEAEARRPAVEGIGEPTGRYKRRPGGYVREYSDTLLIFLLKAARPERYSDGHRVMSAESSPEEFARAIRAALVAMDATVGGCCG